MESQDQLQELIKNIQESELSDEVVEWMESVSKPEEKLIGSMIDCFKQNIDSNPELCESILEALVLLNERVQETVNPQIVSNKEFGTCLVKFIKQTPAEKLTGFELILLISFFEAGVFDEQIDQEFVKSVFESFSLINNQRAFIAIITILLRISAFEKFEDDNPVIAYAEVHENRRFFSEMLAQLLNKMKPGDEDYVWSFIKEYHGRSATPLFYTNDMKLVIDILARKLENNIMDVENGEKIMNALDSLMSTDDYQKCKYKKKYFSDLVNEVKTLDDVPEQNFDLLMALLELIEA